MPSSFASLSFGRRSSGCERPVAEQTGPNRHHAPTSPHPALGSGTQTLASGCMASNLFPMIARNRPVQPINPDASLHYPIGATQREAAAVVIANRPGRGGEIESIRSPQSTRSRLRVVGDADRPLERSQRSTLAQHPPHSTTSLASTPPRARGDVFVRDPPGTSRREPTVVDHGARDGARLGVQHAPGFGDRFGGGHHITVHHERATSVRARGSSPRHAGAASASSAIGRA